MRALASFALPGAILVATAAVASSQNYPSSASFTHHTGGEPFGITFFTPDPVNEPEVRRGWVAEDGGRIRYTDDDGENWVQAFVPGSVRGQLRGIHFYSSTHGFCVGDNGAVLQTTNGGEDWSLFATIYEPVGSELATLHQVYFHDADDGWVMGDDMALYHYVEGDWLEVQPQTPHNADFYDIAFPDPEDRDLFVIASDYGFLYRTEDGGENWQQIEFNVCVEEVCPEPDPGVPECNLEFWAVDFYDESNGVAVGGIVTNNGYILRTADGGETWSHENCMEFNCGSSTCAPVPTFYGTVATGAETALTVGYASTVMRRTTDMDNNGECTACTLASGGYGWDETSQANALSNPPGNWIALADADTAFATAREGRIRKITSGGTVIDDVGTLAWSRIEGGRFTDADTGFLVGQERVIFRRSVSEPDLELVDGPNSGSPGQPNYLRAVDVSGEDVVAVGDGGNIRWSDDGGDTWDDGEGQRPVAFNNVHFGPEGYVYAVGDDGVFDFSTDGGATWDDFDFPTEIVADLHDVHFITEDNWIVVGSNKLVAKTTNGGADWDQVTVAGTGTPTLRAATGSGAHLYVVGDGGRVYRYNSTAGEFQLKSLGSAATTVQLTDAMRVPGTNDIIVTGDQGVVLYYDADKVLQPGQGDELKWSAPKSYMGAKLVAVDMFSATSGMITGFQAGALEVTVAHIPF